jgi:tRNA1Val (adenine37-N6)-methyltransferase
MSALKPFRFKQFIVDDSKCAMKVGTDGVLLGAWADVSAAESILDIGTGCGLIALMAAQRSKACITAIDIDESATLQSKENFLSSPWHERIEAIHIAVQQFQPDFLFDLIICNPPFFKNALKTPIHERNLARHNDTLSFESLVSQVNRLLSKNGKFVFILPLNEAFEVIHIASYRHLHMNRCCNVYSREDKLPNRILAELSRKESAETIETLTIRDQNNRYTAEYKELTKDYYLFLSE